MKKWIVRVLAGVSAFVPLAGLQGQIVSGFGDIELWAGEGPNQSALVIDFHDGEARQSFVWGYRWSGSATGFDMLSAIDSAWQDLTITSPFYVTGVVFTEGAVTHERESGSYASYPADYVSWGYYLAGGSATIFDSNPPYGPTGTLNVLGGGSNFPTSWTLAPSGSSDRQLAHGSWDALSYGQVGEDFNHQTPPLNPAYAAVPEPSVAWVVAVFALGGYFYAKRRLHIG